MTPGFPDREAMLKKVHVAKRQLGLDDESYRDILRRIARRDSSADCTRPQLVDLLAEFTRLGWSGQKRKLSDKAHVRKVFAIWGDMCRAGIPDSPTPAALKSFVRKMTGVDDPEWMTAIQARTVIEALKAWETRELAKGERR
ncbi:MAG: regulatory protein GemA [Magnetospirillum sp.]|nr:regulatory protein GemA [Magnetospirillum sp.]